MSNGDRLFQEDLRTEPFWMLVACVLVNVTRWGQARSVLDGIRARWPTAADLAAAGLRCVRRRQLGDVCPRQAGRRPHGQGASLLS
jgi:hypothetical protein